MKSLFKLIVYLVSFTLLQAQGSATKCQSVLVDDFISYKSADLNAEMGQSLIGSEVFYRAKYRFVDPKLVEPGQKLISEGEGIVVAAQYFENKKNSKFPSTLSLIILTKKGERLTFELRTDDPSLILKVKYSEMAKNFREQVKKDNLKIVHLGLGHSPATWENFFSKNQKLRLLLLNFETKEIKALETKKIKVKEADPMDLMLGRAPVIFSIENALGEVSEILAGNVLFMAY